MKRHTLLYIYIVMCMGMMLVSCDDRIVFSRYASTPAEEVGLRITGDYPFKGLSLVVEQTLHPSNIKFIDTLSCDLIDDVGHAHGKGINHYQYLFPLTTVKLDKGESVHVAIHHCMKREILPGVTDVGLTLSRLVTTSIQTKEDKQKESKAPQR